MSKRAKAKRGPALPVPLSFGRTLVIAPHPDDEVLGAGGTIARLTAEGERVFVAIVTEGRPPAFTSESIALVRAEANQAHALLGVEETFWLGFEAAGLDLAGHSAVNSALSDLVRLLSPETVLLPFPGDIHRDHQLAFLSALVASRPHQESFPHRILAYETLSETNWNAPYLTPGFTPNVFVDISSYFEKKLEAMQCFASQIRSPPHERSTRTLSALAQLRGATVMSEAAEAFVLVRWMLPQTRS
ncbi:PIG-L family deacetylase [Ensifer sp. T173]|uniref:PIG-L family deacetylase n=1 Tax=Ensifer canadensis TaxID=555315 RepID=A0AAW4FSI0_9HYPH|nr:MULTISPECIES: PIG-L deacetylase family protein [Ensifer]KQY73272.1 GlcNAc-PI de-N-acetylase [Ensifer sp. Root142]MBM3094306.1 PIG-L family deacetylase [Ensifer canadensis]UBI80527.1 PIG-L family deacetylase [Ensifer canadensis]